MYSGFDFGTSNCAMGVVNTDAPLTQVRSAHQRVRLLPLEGSSAFMPSALYALHRDLVTESVAKHIATDTHRNEYVACRSNQLAQARQARRQLDIQSHEQSVYFGLQAIDEYFADPAEGYFVKSPKSFLGASGLRVEWLHFFEDIVTAMMQQVKQQAEQHTSEAIEHTVIGRPVNFQGADAEESNRQAIEILEVSAKRAGFKSVEFLFEPIAAGLDFEASLQEDKTVLVVDIGGGTSDCAMVRMGPGHQGNLDRRGDFLGHSGERVGGNDLDILLAGKLIMPLFGMQSQLKNGLPMPTQLFWDAVSTNDVNAQSSFNSRESAETLRQLMRDTQQPELLARFVSLRDNKQGAQVVRSAEQCKIALSDAAMNQVDLSFIEAQLSCDIEAKAYAQAVDRKLSKMVSLMDEAIKQAGCQPDLIYMTGGSAKSHIVKQAVQQKIGQIEILDGDHFGSVAAGLSLWAKRIYA